MAKAIVGFFTGCAVTALVVWFAVLPGVRESNRAVGINDGTIEAKVAIADTLGRKLGRDLVAGESQEPLFSVKTTDVVIVQRNGVKTLRVID